MLAMLRDLSALAPFSLLADAAHVVGMLVVLKDDVAEYEAHHALVSASKGWTAIPFLFGVVIYCYEGIGMILQIEDSMRDKSKVCLAPWRAVVSLFILVDSCL
jgi:proton-coupled amino acid transporter